MASRVDQNVIPLRILVRDPVPGVDLRLQSGRTDLVLPSAVSDAKVTFDLSVRVALPDAEGPVGFFGPFAQGPPHERFVYLNAGRHAGQTNSCWDRRAKIPLTGIRPTLIRRLLKSPGSVLEVAVGGRSRDGGPVCATVKLPADAWQVRSTTAVSQTSTAGDGANGARGMPSLARHPRR